MNKKNILCISIILCLLCQYFLTSKVIGEHTIIYGIMQDFINLIVCYSFSYLGEKIRIVIRFLRY